MQTKGMERCECGPFAESKELVAGYWIWQDLGKELTPELRAKEEKMRGEIERQRRS